MVSSDDISSTLTSVVRGMEDGNDEWDTMSPSLGRQFDSRGAGPVKIFVPINGNTANDYLPLDDQGRPPTHILKGTQIGVQDPSFYRYYDYLD